MKREISKKRTTIAIVTDITVVLSLLPLPLEPSGVNISGAEFVTELATAETVVYAVNTLE